MATPRRCLDCPTLGTWPRGRCPTHDRTRDQARGTRQQRGYDRAHDRTRATAVATLRAGLTLTCWRCGNPITNENDMHIGHDDSDRSITRGPEHRLCNLQAAGRNSHMS